MTPDQYRREGAEAMRAYIANGCDPSHLSRSDNPTEFHAGYRHAAIQRFTAIRAIDVDEVLAGLPTAPDAVARDAVLEEAAKALERFSENWDCWHPESRLCDCGSFVEQWGFAADEVRALKSSVQPEPILSPAATETVPVPVARLVEAARALGAMPEGYCFCSANRVGDDSKIHEPECADLRAALVACKEARDD